MEKKTKSVCRDLSKRFDLLSKLLLPNSKYDITNIPVFGEGLSRTKENLKSLDLSERIARNYTCESKRGLYCGNTFLMFLAASLNKESLEDMLNKGLSEPVEISDYVREIKPLKGKNVVEIGGKRLSATAYALGADKATSLDGGDETGEGGPEERVNLKKYKTQIPFKGDITFSQWALERGYGEVGKTRFEDYTHYAPLNDAMFDILSVFSNLTKQGGYSIHSYSSEKDMKKFVTGEFSYILDFLGFEVVHYLEGKELNEKNVVFKKVEPKKETKNWSFLIHRENKYSEYLASIIKRTEEGEIYETELVTSFKDAYFNLTDIKNMKAIPLSLGHPDIIKDFKKKQKSAANWENYDADKLIESVEDGFNNFFHSKFHSKKYGTNLKPSIGATISPEEAREYVSAIAPKLGFDFTSGPFFPNNRKDVCVMKHSSENGKDYGYDTIYILWNNCLFDSQKGEIKHEVIADSKLSKDYLHIKEIISKEGEITVKYENGGTYSGSPMKFQFTKNRFL